MKKLIVVFIVVTLMITFFIGCRKPIKDVDNKTETPPPSEQQGSKKIIPNNIGDLDFNGIGAYAVALCF